MEKDIVIYQHDDTLKIELQAENKDLAFQTARAHWHLLPTNQPAEESFPYKKNLELTAI